MEPTLRPTLSDKYISTVERTYPTLSKVVGITFLVWIAYSGFSEFLQRGTYVSDLVAGIAVLLTIATPILILRRFKEPIAKWSGKGFLQRSALAFIPFLLACSFRHLWNFYRYGSDRTFTRGNVLESIVFAAVTALLTAAFQDQEDEIPKEAEMASPPQDDKPIA